MDPAKGARPGAALLIIDMINRFDFPGAEHLHPRALAIAELICNLRAAADACGAPVVYVNDNYGQWRAGREQLIEACAATSLASRRVIQKLAPRADDYFVIKPQLSGFYATNLPVLLPKLGVNRVVLTGVAADICILFTAADAHMRDYDVWVPKDAVASEDEKHADWALTLMRKSLSAETRATTELSLAEWMGREAKSA